MRRRAGWRRRRVTPWRARNAARPGTRTGGTTCTCTPTSHQIAELSTNWENGRQDDNWRIPVPLRKLGFLTIGLFDEADPRRGHEATLEIIQLGEQLGLDSAWVRHRHLQFGISSPVAFLAAATQRTSRIQLGTAVIPLGWENPLRLAEDLATVDVLSGGRLNPGVSVGQPMHYDDVKNALYPDTQDVEDFSYQRVHRLLAGVRGDAVSTFSGQEGI